MENKPHLSRKRFMINATSSDSEGSNSIKSSATKIKELENIKANTLELIEFKDDQINRLETHVAHLEKKILQHERFREMQDEKLYQARRETWDERSYGLKLYNTLKDCTMKVEFLHDKLDKQEEQLQAAQVAINDLADKLDLERKKNAKHFNIANSDPGYDGDEPELIITKDKFKFRATIKADNNLKVDMCSLCMEDRLIAKSCCGVNYCNKCYFSLGDFRRNGVLLQIGCDLCKNKKKVQQVAINPLDDYEEESDEPIDDDTAVTRRMWLYVMDAIRHDCKTFESIRDSLRDSMNPVDIRDTLDLMELKRRIRIGRNGRIRII